MSIVIGTTGVLSIVPRSEKPWKSLGGYVELCPYKYMLDTVIGTNGKTYRFDVYVREDGLIGNLHENNVATCMAHPLGMMWHKIRGPALIVPYDEDINYTMDDANAIVNATVYDEGCDEDLLDRNAAGNRATVRM